MQKIQIIFKCILIKQIIINAQVDEYLHKENENCYSLLLDAGSTGTTLSIFFWKCFEYRYPEEKVIVDTLGEEWRIEPSLSSFNNNIDQLDAYLGQFIYFAQSQIPEQKWAYTPIMLGATAGMRLLSDYDQFIIMKQARYILKNSGFMFESNQWCRILTGSEEGASMWLTMNYLLGNLYNNNTVTIVDVGGASTQIAFSYKDRCEHDSDIEIDFFSLTVYSESHLFYGKEQALEKIIASLHTEGESVIKFPCFNIGYSEQWSQNPDITVTGIGDGKLCRYLISANMRIVNNPKHLKDEAICQSDYEMNPPYDQEIYGVCNVRFASNALHYGEDEFTPYQMRIDAENLCNQSWEDLVKIYGTKEFVNQHCFLTTYISTLFIDGYNIPKFKQIKVPKHVSNIQPSWALGAVLLNIEQFYTDCKNRNCDFIKEFF